jgi:Uma2 family endonuclease
MAEPLPVHPLTVDDYHAMHEAGILTEEDRVELIDGQIINRMTIGPKHIRIVNILTEAAVLRGSETVEVSVQNSVQISLYSEPEPDIVLLRRDRDVTRVPQAEDVLLLVEVADATLLFDKRVKLPLYAAARIPEVWIVNIPERRLECYRDPTPSGYAMSAILDERDVVEALLVPALGTVSISSLLAG